MERKYDMIKFWWHDEPIILGSLRWQIINNDLKNNIKDCLKQYNAHTTIDEAAKIAHERGLCVLFELIPK